MAEVARPEGVCRPRWSGLLLLAAGIALTPTPSKADAPTPQPPAAPASSTSPGASDPTVELDILAGEDAKYVTVGQQTCAPPCRLRAGRGIQPFVVSGARGSAGHLVVDGPGRFQVVNPLRPHLIAGAILLPAGAVIGATMWMSAWACPRRYDGLEGSCLATNLILWPVLGAAMVVTGAALLLYAATSVHELRPVADTAARSGRRGLRFAGAGIAPLPAGATVGAALEF